MTPETQKSAAFEETVLPLRQELYAQAMRLTRNERDAEDLVQDTMLKALAAWSSFRPDSNCRSWCYRILTNTFITGFRRRCTEQRALRQTPEELRRMTSSATRRAAESPEAAVTNAGFGDEVVAALGALSPEFREVLMLHHVQGRSYKEIGRITGSPLGTVMSRLHRARQAMRLLLEPYAGAAGIGLSPAAEPLQLVA